MPPSVAAALHTWKSRSTYKEHFTAKTAQKIQSRNNILGKLAGTSWGRERVGGKGAKGDTLRPTAQALAYCIAGYCATHSNELDVQPNEAMRRFWGPLL